MAGERDGDEQQILVLANTLLQTRETNGRVKPVKNVNDVNSDSFYRNLFWTICGPVIDEEPLLPNDSDLTELIKGILDFVSCNLLNVDLSEHFSPKEAMGRRCVKLQLEAEALNEKRKRQYYSKCSELFKNIEHSIHNELTQDLGSKPQTVIQKIARLEKMNS